MRLFILLFFFIQLLYSQNINLNDEFSYSFLRNSILKGSINTDNSFNVRPLNSEIFDKEFIGYRSIFSNQKKTVQIKYLGTDYFL